MNIEEIKKMVDEAVPSLENAQELRYLLSIIKQAEKVLEQAYEQDGRLSVYEVLKVIRGN